MPRSNFGERDGNMASKDIAESPTASPERPDKLSAISGQQSVDEN